MRHARAGQYHQRGARARPRWALSCNAARLGERHGGIPVPGIHGPHPQHFDLHDRRLSHPGALCHLPGRAHQHQPGVVLPRRGASRHRLCRRAPGEPGCGRAEDGRCGAATAQFHTARGFPLQDPDRLHLRERRSAGAAGTGADARGLERLREAPRPEREGGEAARHRHRDGDREHGRRPGGEGRGRARARRRGQHHRLHHGEIPGTRARDHLRHDRGGRARRAARARAAEAVRAGEAAPAAGQSHRRLAQHGGRRQRVPPRGAEAD